MSTLLIIEDNPVDTHVLRTHLEDSGFDVINVTTAEAGEALLGQENVTIDGIVLDVVLPGKSGYGLCRELKRSESTANIPIILCSSKSERMDRKWGLKQGANAYLTKPVEGNEIVSTVRQLVS
ncbi:response regulator receiver protein [[Leptolyngbya] sp. PCC 7376]|uniref:response regulator transcription factor n=1 Tax=[Leptolyngbya] sp. PCC 7376 TaxID=111781 RepID=UPI00029F0254|nr:response regulator [[Leptolyngbya] sp. PCC 7376]AFY38695.1 response regulator receiver protein [[Leptolyngbya] sp. PCC 7376]